MFDFAAGLHVWLMVYCCRRKDPKSGGKEFGRTSLCSSSLNFPKVFLFSFFCLKHSSLLYLIIIQISSIIIYITLLLHWIWAADQRWQLHFPCVPNSNRRTRGGRNDTSMWHMSLKKKSNQYMEFPAYLQICTSSQINHVNLLL